MRLLLGLMGIMLVTFAFTGCDKETLGDESSDTALVQAVSQEQDTAEGAPVARPVETPEGKSAETAPDGVVVTVNGEPITNAHVMEEVDKRVEAMKQRMPAGQEISEAQKQQIRVGVTDMLVQKEMLNQMLAKKNITVTDEEIIQEIAKAAEAKGQTLDEVNAEIAQYGMTMEDLKSQVRPQVQIKKLAAAYTDDPEMAIKAKQFYEENPAYFQAQEQVRASHILLGKRGITPEEKPEYLEKIKEVEAKLKAGESFETLAREYSTCPSSAKGGDLGFFGRGQMDPAFEKAAFELNVGETSGIVESSFGYHIIKVTDKKEAGMTPFEEVKESIISYLLRQQMQENDVIEFSEAEEALRQQVQQQQMIQQQMMQQIQKQMAEQQAQQQAEQGQTEQVEPAEE